MKPLLIAGAIAVMLAVSGRAQPSESAEPFSAQASRSAGPVSLARLEPVRLQLDQLEAALSRESASDDLLVAARNNLNPVREALREEIVSLEQRFAEADARLKQLGALPAAGSPPESETIATERARLTEHRGNLDAALKQARLLTLRTDGLIERIIERRRALFARELFVRTSSALDPGFWRQAAATMPDEIRGITMLLRSWWSYAQDTGGVSGIVGAALTLLIFAIAAIVFGRWIGRWAIVPAVAGTRFARAFAALMMLLRIALLAPSAVVVIVLVLDSFGLMPARIMEFGLGLVIAVAVSSFGHGVAVGLFAPGQADRRLLHIDDIRARLLADHLTIAARVLGVVVTFNIIQRTIVAPVSWTVATSALLAAIIMALLIHVLLRLAKSEAAPEGAVRGQWVRGAGWLIVAAIAVSLATGYVGFAAFLAGRLLVVLGVGGALYICLAFTDSLFGEMLTGDTPRGRAVASFFGLKPRSIELIGTLLSAVIRLLLVLVVIIPLLGPWGLFAADFFDVLKNAAFGFRIGEITISITAILGAFVLLLVGVLATRAVQRWLQTRFLPRTSLEPSLQHSVSTIFGYVGVVAALSLALAELGLDLQKITLVAGALSIGIGFGLQSVVSNFVSGLILLTERPIRVGDMIVVKGEEGYVRRIRVRATEIETFERASVIIPNSELITGVVKNWTHANTLGRIIVKVGVGYDSDVEKVRDLLLGIAREHRQVLQSPVPKVFLTNFGDSALEFELRCVVSNVEEGPAIKSDLCFAILAHFREAGIVIPYPQREVTWRPL